MNNDNPMTEQALEHFLAKCIMFKEKGKNLENLIGDLTGKLKVIKSEKFFRYEDELSEVKA